MQLKLLLAALPLAFATPVPEANPQGTIPNIPGAVPTEAPATGVQITGVSYAGSGCNAGTVASVLSSDLSTLTLLYDSFVAQAGDGLAPAAYRKNCQLNVALAVVYGAGTWLIVKIPGQYSVFKVDYRGYAYLQKGDKGVCKATYYFSGFSNQVSSTLTLNGPYDDNYLKTDQFGIETTVWSPCGQEGFLNVNSEVRLTPIDNKKTALLTVGFPKFSGPGMGVGTGGSWSPYGPGKGNGTEGPGGPKPHHPKPPREIVSTNRSPLGRFHRSQVLPGPLPPVAEVLSVSPMNDMMIRDILGSRTVRSYARDCMPCPAGGGFKCGIGRGKQVLSQADDVHSLSRSGMYTSQCDLPIDTTSAPCDASSAFNV
ncbi:hypothetical protein LIA77_08202 [Sarocladium implicatum]|nr:hypothetical protein LIA77_08202 [Sarocladium implicatum]